MEFDGSWSMEKKVGGLEKTFCCLNARARDFAKLGRLYLKKGDWNGKEILPASWVQESTTLTTDEGASAQFRYNWWVHTSGDGSYYAQGILGQYIYINPAKELIIVRLGKDYGNIYWPNLFRDYAESIN
jgi:CubicO group peptidase (beta-lactamase class C family)